MTRHNASSHRVLELIVALGLFTTLMAGPAVAAPSVTSITPTHGAADVPITINVVVTFSQQVDPDTVNEGTFRLLRPDGARLPGVYSVAEDNRRATFDPQPPDGNLTKGVTYRVRLDGYRGLAGAVGPSSSSSFTTSDGQAAPPPPTPQGTNLGLHVTAKELAIWRQRAINGPYKSKGDVSTNSPGDWDRIVSEKSRFMQNPASFRWGGPSTTDGIPDNGCVASGRAGIERPYTRDAEVVNGAAFYALVKKDVAAATAVARELSSQVNFQDTNFTDRQRYCLASGMLGDHPPGFTMGDWITNVLYAYDYVLAFEKENDRILFTQAKRDELKRWFNGIAEWFAHRNHAKVKENFTRRVLGDFAGSNYATTSNADKVGPGGPIWDGGPIAKQSAHRFNNRNSRMMRAVGIIGVHTQNRQLIDMAKQYYKEVLAFGVFPQGAVSDFHRGPGDDADSGSGLKYAIEIVSGHIMFADALARTRDYEMYNFSTTEGANGTRGSHWTGGPKTLEKLLVDLGRYVDPRWQPQRKAGGDVINTTADGKLRIHDVALAPANLFFKNDAIQDAYMRRGGAPPYPARAAAGKFTPERGDTGSLPGVLFMFGQMEDKVNPYS